MNENRVIERILKVDWLDSLGCAHVQHDGGFDVHGFVSPPYNTPECLEVRQLQVSSIKGESTKLFELQTLAGDGQTVFDFAFREVKPWFSTIMYAIKDIEEEMCQDYTVCLEFTPNTSPKYRRSKLLSAIGIISDTIFFRFGGPKLEQRRLLIHQGNYPRDSRGCLLVGTRAHRRSELHSGSQVIVGSSMKMNELWSKVGQENAVHLYIPHHILGDVFRSLIKD